MYDISNRRRLGLSEVQCVQDMYSGVKKLLEIEKAAIAYVLLCNGSLCEIRCAIK